MSNVDFDQLIKDGRISEALCFFAKEGYNNGDFGHTRKLLIEHAAEQVEQVNSMAHIIKLKNKEIRELSNFLKERNVPLKELSPLVTVMSYVEWLEEELRCERRALVNQEKSSDSEVERLRQQNKRYREALEEIWDSSTNDIAEFIALKTLEESK